MRKNLESYGGALTGGLYGLLIRILLGQNFRDFADLFSITFIWIVPVLIGLTPLLFSSKEDLQSVSVRIVRPVSAVFTFFVLCYWTGREDLLCIIIISIPFLLVAGIAGILLGKAVLHYRQKNGNLYSVFLIPFITGLIEPAIPTPSQQFETTSTVIISANKTTLWNNLVRVDEIKENEYQKGIFNYAGLPRPLFAELDKDTLGGIRIGNFEGGLKFQENVTSWDRNNSITFDINIIPSTTERTIFERHMLNGNHFKFLNATYELEEISKNQTRLSLTTQYQLDTKINFYGEFWGKLLLTDFQERLLEVIQKRCEK